MISDIYYIGLPVRKYPDFTRLAKEISDGSLLQKISEKEPVFMEDQPKFVIS